MRIAVLLAAVLACGVTVPASAAPVGTPTRIQDVPGDANYVNDGGEYDAGDTATPGSDPGLDVLVVVLRPTRSPSGKVDGLTIVVDTLAPLRDRALIALKTRTQNCADILVKYTHTAPAPRAVLSSGCSSDVVSLSASVDGTRLTVTVPYAAMPPNSARDKTLQTINVFSQLHLTDEPLRHRPVGVLAADTTLAAKTYRLR